MGRATRWFKSILGLKKQNDREKTMSNEEGKREKMCKVEGRWSFTKIPTTTTKEKMKGKENHEWYREYSYVNENETKHAIAVAAATAAAADAAVAAAQAAVAVVRLTSHGRAPLFSNVATANKQRYAAVKIQTRFRSYLARRALKALKGLVKLQAHVRGYLVRKRAAATLQSMQALIRAQATARSQRANLAFNQSKKIQSEFRARKSMDRFDDTRSDQFHSKRLSTSYETYNNAFEGSPKIVEIDTFKPRSRSRRINPSLYDFSGEDLQYPTMSSPLPIPYPGRVSIPDCRSTNHDSDWSFYGDECRISTAQSTPRLANSTRSNGPPTPTKSVCGDSFFRPYSNFPSYMADTQSFRAKLRSQSAPKLRPESRSKNRPSLDEIMAARNSISGVRMQRSSSQVQDFSLNF